MAEKITERKEYRGLGYAPSISVPGLVETRPIAATRPPQTNELTKLAKSLGDFGETFANTQLRKAAREDQEAEQLATEALSSVALGGWVKDAQGNPVPKFGETPSGGDAGMDYRALAFKGTDDDLRGAYEKLGIPKEVTPAFYAYLRKGMAKSIAQEFKTRLIERTAEAANDYAAADGFNSQIMRQVIQEESRKIEDRFGKGWHLYAPEEVRAAEQSFIDATGSQIVEKREKAVNDNFKQSLLDVFTDPSLSDDEYYGKLSETIDEGFQNGVDVKERTSEAARLSVSSLLSKGNTGAASALTQKLIQGQIILGKSGKVPMLDAETEAELLRMVEAGEHKDRLNRNQRQQRMAQVMDADIQAFLLNKPNAGLQEIQKFVDGLLSKEIDLLENDDKGQPIRMTPSLFDKAVFNRDALTSMVLDAKNRSATRVELTSLIKKDIDDQIRIGTPKAVEAAKTALAENKNSLTSTDYQRLSERVKEAEALSEIEGAQNFDLELRAGMAALEPEAGIDPASPIGPTQEQTAILNNLNSEFFSKFKAAARENLRTWMEGHPNAKEDERRAATEKAISDARKTVIEEMTEKSVAANRMEQFKDAETLRASLHRDHGTFDNVFDLTERFDAQMSSKTLKIQEEGTAFLKTLAPSGFKKGETVEGKLKSLPLNLQRLLIAQRAKIADDYNKVVRSANRERSVLTKALMSGQKTEFSLLGIAQRKPFKKVLLTLDDQKELTTRLRDMLSHTGVTPQEVITKSLNVYILDANSTVKGAEAFKSLALQQTKFGEGDEEVSGLFNPYTTPMFQDTNQLRKLMKEEGDNTTIEKMMDSLGLENSAAMQKQFLDAQLQLLRSRGR